MSFRPGSKKKLDYEALVQFNKGLRDGDVVVSHRNPQPQPGALVAPVAAAVDLPELLEDRLEVLGSDTDPRIAYAQYQLLVRMRHLHGDHTRVGKLRRV